MEVVSRRRGQFSRNGGVVSGSVWENRMRLDQVKGGIKVFSNSEDKETPEAENDEKTTVLDNNNQVQVDKKVEMGQKSNVGVGKRKTWKSENLEGNPIQIARKSKNLDKECKELSVSVDGMKKSPSQNKKTRSSSSSSYESTGKELVVSMDGNEKSPVKTMKAKSPDGVDKNCELRKIKSVPPNGNVKNSLQLVKAKSATSKEIEENDTKNCDGISRSLIESKRSNFEENKIVVVESNKNLGKSFEGIEKKRSEENGKEFGVCEDKAITSNVKSPSKEKLNLDDDDEEWDEVLEEVIEKASVDVKEINVAEHKPKKIVTLDKKLHIIKKQTPPISAQARIHHPSPTTTKSVPVSDEFQRIPRQHSNLESFVDLVMWRDVSKSAFIFGIGTFFIISSSFTQDLNISFISVISYLTLVYLAAIFLFRSLIKRGDNGTGEASEYVVGEEEAVWVLKLILPYINECLLKIRALFSGDPATTMKMALLLFILARCGSSITIWKMSKLGFFGVFIVPKVCSSYYTQLTAYGTFWIRRFGDAWESCTHKKAVAFAIFTLIWNLSSIIARIWAVFMLYVGFRYYQQKMMKEGWVGEEAEEKFGGQRQVGRRSTIIETRKLKKTL